MDKSLWLSFPDSPIVLRLMRPGSRAKLPGDILRLGGGCHPFEELARLLLSKPMGDCTPSLQARNHIELRCSNEDWTISAFHTRSSREAGELASMRNEVRAWIEQNLLSKPSA